MTRSKNAWRYTSTPQYVLMAWYLDKHRDNFTFNLIFLYVENVTTPGTVHNVNTQAGKNLFSNFNGFNHNLR